MNKTFFKISNLVLVVMLMFSFALAAPTVQAAGNKNDFSMKEFDKGYITFVFDDGKMPFSEECFELFNSFKMPMCCAVIANTVSNNQSAVDLFKRVESAGGEILSHTLNHNVLHKDNCKLEVIEAQLGTSYKILSGLGFDINGVIETGNGGGEATANYELIETVSRKYYKYSNAYGVSPQYKKQRLWLRYNTLDSMKVHINEAINKKQWLVISAHDFSEFSKENMTQLLMYIDMQGKNKVEVVNWKYIYEKFGNYTGPQVPTLEAIESVCKTYGHDLENSTIKQQATCEKNAVEEGKCKRCGKTATREIKDTAGHKFGKYVSDNNATCTEFATKTAKCTVKGCNATDTIVDTNSQFKHSYKIVTVKEATDKAEGLAERKCELCGTVKETIVIPKGQKAEDVVVPEEETSSENKPATDDTTNTIGASDGNEQTENLNPNGNSGKISTPLLVVLIVVLTLLVAAIGILAFLLIKKFKS